MAAKDLRIKLINEIISGMKVLLNIYLIISDLKI